jgi:hypothetical protein
MTNARWHMPRPAPAPPEADPDAPLYTTGAEPVTVFSLDAKLTALAERMAAVLGATGQIDPWAEVGRLRLLCERHGIDPDDGASGGKDAPA